MAKDEKQTEKKDELAKGGVVQGADGKPALVNAGGGTQQGSSGSAGEKAPEVPVDKVYSQPDAPEVQYQHASRLEHTARAPSVDAIKKVGAALAHLDRIHAQGPIMDALLLVVARDLAFTGADEDELECLAVLHAMAEAAGKGEAAMHIAAAIKALE